jgi:hypothetical protein
MDSTTFVRVDLGQLSEQQFSVSMAKLILVLVKNHADVKPPSWLGWFPRPQKCGAAPTAECTGEPEGKGTHQGGGT